MIDWASNDARMTTVTIAVRKILKENATIKCGGGGSLFASNAAWIDRGIM